MKNPVTTAWITASSIVGTIAYVVDNCRETYENVEKRKSDNIADVEKMKCKVFEDWCVKTGQTPQFP